MKTWRWLLSGIMLVACASIWYVHSNQTSGKPRVSYMAIVGDLDGDKDQDVLLTYSADEAESTNTLWINQGGVQGNSAGKFIANIQEIRAMDSQTAALGDLDEDGDLDIVIGTTGGFEVFLNSGGPQGGWQGNFQLQYTQGFPSQTSEFRQAALGDLDSDGDLDAYFGMCCGETPEDSIWINDGKGKFTNRGVFPPEMNVQQVALGDLDGDLDLDIWAILDRRAQVPSDKPVRYTSSQVWFNDGSGHFINSAQPLGEPLDRAVALGDLDGDGDQDAFLSGGSISTIWENDGDGHFSVSAQLSSQLSAELVILGDLDQDGDQDALLSSGELVETWLNHGRGAFERSDQRIDLQKYSAVGLGDLDGDGDLDLFSGYLNNHYRIWWNDGFGRLGLSWR